MLEVEMYDQVPAIPPEVAEIRNMSDNMLRYETVKTARHREDIAQHMQVLQSQLEIYRRQYDELDYWQSVVTNEQMQRNEENGIAEATL